MRIDSLVLGWPPSVNHYWKRTKSGGMAVSPKGNTFIRCVNSQWIVYKCENRIYINTLYYDMLHITIKAIPPDGRKRDLDNIMKATFDAIVKAKIIEDDSNIKRISATMEEKDPHGLGRIILSIDKYMPGQI